MTSSSFSVKRLHASRNEIYSNIPPNSWVAKAFVGLTHAKERATGVALTVFSNTHKVPATIDDERELKVIKRKNHLKTLPHDLIFLILSYLNPIKELGCAAQTCHLFNAAVLENPRKDIPLVFKRLEIHFNKCAKLLNLMFLSKMSKSSLFETLEALEKKDLIASVKRQFSCISYIDLSELDDDVPAAQILKILDFIRKFTPFLQINKLRSAFTPTELKLLEPYLQEPRILILKDNMRLDMPSRIQDDSLVDFEKNFQKLEVLDLSGTAITDNLLRRYGPYLTNLRELFLSCCLEVRDPGFIEAIPHLTKLTVLEVNRTGVSNASLRLGANYFGSSLTHLSIEMSLCTLARAEILQLFPNLETLDMQPVADQL